MKIRLSFAVLAVLLASPVVAEKEVRLDVFSVDSDNPNREGKFRVNLNQFAEMLAPFQDVGAGVEDGDKGDVVVDDDGATWTVDADSVALGTDTTGGYAASLTEGGAATTATALAANPDDCDANEFANAIAASGALTCSALVDADVPDTITVDNATTATALAANPGDCDPGEFANAIAANGDLTCDAVAGSGDFVGPGSSTDNAVVRFDSTTGKLGQDSDLTVSDVAGGVVTLATTAGNALTVDLVEPAAANGASVAGDPLSMSAGNAVASLDTAGAAVGGNVTITAGNAARLTSGNANGGNIVLATGTGIGTGTAGQVLVGAGTVAVPSIASSGTPGTGINFPGASITISTSGTQRISFGTSISTTATSLFASGGTTFRGFILDVEASTAGSGAPDVHTAGDAWQVFTNEGSTAENYHTLPSAVAGYAFTFIVQDADGIRITATAGDTIRIGSTVSSTGGFIRCGTQGGIVHLTAINATEWFVEEHYVTCTVDS